MSISSNSCTKALPPEVTYMNLFLVGKVPCRIKNGSSESIYDILTVQRELNGVRFVHRVFGDGLFIIDSDLRKPIGTEYEIKVGKTIYLMLVNPRPRQITYRQERR
jgi:hypothetical protein